MYHCIYSDSVSCFPVLRYHHHFVIGIFLGILCPCQCRRVAAAPMVQYPRVMCVATASIGSCRGWSRGLSSGRPLGGPPHSPRLFGHSVLSVLCPALLIDFCRPPRHTGAGDHYAGQGVTPFTRAAPPTQDGAWMLKMEKDSSVNVLFSKFSLFIISTDFEPPPSIFKKTFGLLLVWF